MVNSSSKPQIESVNFLAKFLHSAQVKNLYVNTEDGMQPPVCFSLREDITTSDFMSSFTWGEEAARDG